MRTPLLLFFLFVKLSPLMAQSVKEYRGYSTLTNKTDTVADSLVSVIMRYDSFERLNETWVVEYDDSLNRIDSILTRYNTDGEPIFIKSANTKVVYSYDVKGSLKSIDYEGDDNSHKIRYSSHYNWLGLLKYQKQIDENGISDITRKYRHFIRYKRMSVTFGPDAKSSSVYRYHWLTGKPTYVKHTHDFYGTVQKNQFYYKRKWNGDVVKYYEIFNDKPSKKIISKYSKAALVEKIEYNYDNAFERHIRFETIYY